MNGLFAKTARVVDSSQTSALQDHGARRHILIGVAPILALLMFFWASLLNALPLPEYGKVVFYSLSGMSLLAIAGLLLARRIDDLNAGMAIAFITGCVFALRLMFVFSSDHFDDHGRSFFVPMFSYFAIYYALLMVALPHPHSARAAVLVWVSMAAYTTVASFPHWGETPPHPVLAATLQYVWLGQPLILLLLFGWARQQRRLVDAHTRLVERERALSVASATSELRFRSIFDQATAGIGLIGPERRWIDVNERMAELTGYTVAELRGMSLCQLLPPEDREVGIERMAAFLASDTAPAQITIERRWLRRDGSTVWVSNHLRRIPPGAGLPASALLMSIDISDRHQAEEATQHKQNELRAIFEQAGVGIAMLDEQGHWLTVNQRICDIVGRSEAELLVTDFQTLTHPDDLELDLLQARQVAAGEIPGYTMEKRYLKLDGSVVWVRLHVGRIDATATTPMRYVSVVEDISEQKRAELQAAEHQRVRDFHFDNTLLAVIEWTPDFRVLRWSPRATELYGWEEHEVIGRSVSEWAFIHDADLARVGAEIERMFNGSVCSAEISNRNYHKDGHTVWCQWHNSVLRDADGRPLSIFSLVKDVSDEQLTIAALRDSQARFQSIFEQSAVGIVMIDVHGNWLMVNERFREIVGHDADSLMQNSCEDITEAKDRAAEAVLRGQLVRGEIDHYNLEKRYRRRDGKPVWVSVYVRVLEKAGETVKNTRLSLVVVDITERRKAEAEIRKLNADLESRVALRTEQLNDTVRNWALRNQELRVLGEMMALLPAARDLTEASRIIECYLPQIFSRCGGAVWLEDAIPQRMTLLGNWGRVQKSPLSLAHDDCWGIRRGQTLRVEDPADPLLCPHLHASLDAGQQRPHACVPVIALGQSVGLIHLEWSERFDTTESPPDPVLIRNVAEQVGLAIGNVRLREELRRQAVRDPLTGLYNRRHFDEILKNRIAEHGRNGRRFALLMIDIDHFKRINDEHGHDIGDEVLREVASLLARTVRIDEAAFRIGGEEFVMIVDDSDGTGGQAAGCAERVRREVEALRVIRRDRVLPPMTVSIGLARYPLDVPPGTSPLQRADTALYTAKRTGRNRVCTAAATGHKDGVIGLVKS